MTGASTPARLGVFGGTFNPVHIGHLRAAEEVAEALELERVVFVPSATPPHKAGEEHDEIAPARERAQWVRLAVSGNPRFDVDTMELDREGPSYSVDTLRTLGTRVAPALPVFLIGLDAFAEIDTWREPQTLFTLAHFAVLPRPPLREHSLEKWLPACLRSEVDLASDGRSGRHRSAGTWVRLMPITELDISATAVRARVRAGRSVRYLVPEGVREAVLASGVYQPKGN